MKPDAFDRMVEKESFYDDGIHVVSHDDAITLLRRYHARVRRMVRRIKPVATNANPLTPFGEGYEAACNAILETLDAMKRGKA